MRVTVLGSGAWGTALALELHEGGHNVAVWGHDPTHGREPSTNPIRRLAAYVQFEGKMRDEQGLRLGLAIAKKLAELHGGRLAIHSDKETGTIVTVKLPRLRKA